MTVRECYQRMNSDYGAIIERLGTDELVERFMYKFLEDGSMNALINAIEAGNIEDAFKAVHTLKGVVSNLGFTDIQESASKLTEQLRPQDKAADVELYSDVLEKYSVVVDTIKQYRDEK